MDNSDSLDINGLQNRIDSLDNAINTQVNTLTNIIEKSQIEQTYFSDILSHQWTLLSIQTAIFIGIIFIFLTVAGLISWKFFFQKVENRLDNFEGTIDESKGLNEKFDKLGEALEKTSLNALRSLYEGTENRVWKVIWHVRYCELFFDMGADGLLHRLKRLKIEFEALKESQDDYAYMKRFENLAGIKKVLLKIAQSEDQEVSSIVVGILNDLEFKDK